MTAGDAGSASVFGAGRGRLTVGVCLIMTVVAFELLGAATALPAAVDDIGGLPLYGWALSVPLISGAMWIPIGGRLADRRGLASPTLLALVLFGVGLIGVGAGALDGNGRPRALRAGGRFGDAARAAARDRGARIHGTESGRNACAVVDGVDRARTGGPRRRGLRGRAFRLAMGVRRCRPTDRGDRGTRAPGAPEGPPEPTRNGRRNRRVVAPAGNPCPRSRPGSSSAWRS